MLRQLNGLTRHRRAAITCREQRQADRAARPQASVTTLLQLACPSHALAHLDHHQALRRNTDVQPPVAHYQRFWGVEFPRLT